MNCLKTWIEGLVKRSVIVQKVAGSIPGFDYPRGDWKTPSLNRFLPFSNKSEKDKAVK